MNKVKMAVAAGDIVHPWSGVYPKGIDWNAPIPVQPLSSLTNGHYITTMKILSL